MVGDGSLIRRRSVIVDEASMDLEMNGRQSCEKGI